MKPEQIKLDDWQRILLGDVPGSFYLEVIGRAAVVYLILMVSMRLMGKRMASQMSRIELLALASLAASIGIPLMTPDRGILPGVISAAVIVAGQRVLSRWTAKNETLEGVLQGRMNILVEDGVMRLNDMQQTTVTRERLFAQLRSKGLYNLGNVKFMFMEAGGDFTLIKNSESKPGLSVLPEWDKSYSDRHPKARGFVVCKKCGNTRQGPIDNTISCPNCGEHTWVAAVQ